MWVILWIISMVVMFVAVTGAFQLLAHIQHGLMSPNWIQWMAMSIVALTLFGIIAGSIASMFNIGRPQWWDNFLDTIHGKR